MSRVHTAAARISQGSDLLWRRLTDGLSGWVRAGTSTGDRLVRLVILTGISVLLVRAVWAKPLALWPLSCGWLVLAWRSSPTPTPRPDDTPADAGDASAEDHPQTPPPGRDDLTAALHAVAAPHAHIKALATHLHTTPTRVREGLTQAGIPVSDGVRMKGRGVSTGVSADDIPPLPATPTPTPGGVVAAGQRATTTATPLRVESREGMTIIHDPADTHRHHQVDKGVNTP